jgi:preprotein translocase subunit SecD
MKLLSLALTGLLTLSTQLEAQSPTPPIIELRLAVTRAESGYAPRQLADTTFHVSDRVLFSDADIQRADTSWSEDILTVRYRLTSEAAARIAEMTKDREGDRIAVFFNGEFSSAIPLASPLGGRRGLLDAVGPPKALDLAAQIVARWPPRR